MLIHRPEYQEEEETEKPKIEEKRTNLVFGTAGTQPRVDIGAPVKPEAREMETVAAPLTTKQLPEIAAHGAEERKSIIVFRALPPTVHLGHLVLTIADAGLAPSHPPRRTLLRVALVDYPP
jgi:hypothetical protein